LQPSRSEVVVKVANAVAAAILLGATPAFGQTDQPAPPQRPTFRSEAAIVSLNVSVQDSGAKYVSGLQPADFVVYEDGVRQDVRFFESATVPVDLIVLIDSSSSMMDRMETVREAATGFLKTLRPGDRGAVISFANTVSVLQPLTSDKALLAHAVRQTVASGNTCLHNAVYIALRQFGQPAKQNGQVRRQAIVVLSDGQDTASLVTFEDVLALSRRTGVNIYTVSLRSDDPVRASDTGARLSTFDADRALKTLARETGGQSFFPAAKGLRKVYATIAAELANQYSIGYEPANTRADGGFRRVIVQIITRPSLHPRTRVGYSTGDER
jgi:VWFA-related protein